MKKILIIDDDFQFKAAITKALLPYYDCYTASNGLEGIQMIGEVEPDVIILDVFMPEMSGLKMLEVVGLIQIPIIILSSDPPSIMETIEKYGITNTWNKNTLDFKTLKLLIQSLIG